MFFTLFYMYATILQWWRLGSLKNKLNGTLNGQNALLACSVNVMDESKKCRGIENLLFCSDDRVGCTVVPKQKINLSQWVSFPKDFRYFPIHFSGSNPKIQPPSIYIMLQAVLETYTKHQAEILQVENYGELIAWRANDNFETILKTDMDKLTKLLHCYSQTDIDINHDLKLLRIETVEIEGVPSKIRYDKRFSIDSLQKYSYAPVHWGKFSYTVKDIYSKIRDTTTPKITIENGATKSEELKKQPVSEVKPVKKEVKKSDDKNTLEVSSDYRRHKSTEHKKEKTSSKSEKSKEDLKGREVKSSPKRDKENKKDFLSKDKFKEHNKNREKRDEESKKDLRDQLHVKERHSKKEAGENSSESKESSRKFKEELKEKEKLSEIKKNKLGHDKKNFFEHKIEKSKVKLEKTKIDIEESPKLNNTIERTKNDLDDFENDFKADDYDNTPSCSKDVRGNRISKKVASSGSLEKKLVKTPAVCDETDLNDSFKASFQDFKGKRKGSGEFLKASNVPLSVPSRSKHTGNIKPPNILVYADSPIAKENVTVALNSLLNKDKYIVYDLPTNVNQMTWGETTSLVIVCGAVPQNVTFHLLQYLVTGGQLLCLCSDLLYSVLHTFTTAEVREHELVRFSYGRWKQVKMMHHIFCYQASPAKKQFSKDSDNSNQSSGNGSSPVAPRTPSAVEIQHNGQDYVVQVQVLGTEETWQTPSLLLATVKGTKGRAIFSQVHLEINPNQYEDDENKFSALKDSDEARIEILKDILLNHLDIDCTCSMSEIKYSPAYFLGRHDLKLKLLLECPSIENNELHTEKLSLKFCGKDEKPENATRTFLPVFIHSCPSNFSTVNYFEALETESIGRLVIYGEVMSSSQFVLSKTLTHGLAVISRQLTHAVGRSNNHWISPLGSSTFSLQVHVRADSPLGKVIPLAQHVMATAIVTAIKNIKGCENIDIGLKWPNDVYANGQFKLGGTMVQSSIIGDLVVLNFGVGFNLDNQNPTVPLNDLIRKLGVAPLSYERYYALVFNEFELILKKIQEDDFDFFYERYYKNWLHNNSLITVTSTSGSSKEVRILGIDNYGYLRVRAEDGSMTTVQPDGNSFDILKGLILPKNF